MSAAVPLQAEWLEADGLGGFASGTVSTERTRRYHAWLLSAVHPPTDRFVLVNGADVWIETAGCREYLSVQHYAPDVVVPESSPRIVAFTTEPWPTWVFQLTSGATVQQELCMAHGSPATLVRWTLLEPDSVPTPIELSVRPLFSGRDYHSLHHENASFQFSPVVDGERLIWMPYPGVPPIQAISNGAYRHEPYWYRQFLYPAERDRGLDCQEDLAAPGVFTWNLHDGPARISFSAVTEFPRHPAATANSSAIDDRLQQERSRRSEFVSPLHRAADAYLVRRGSGQTLIAGYPWFTDWGRDTFIALRGLCLTTGRLEVAESILVSWSEHVSEGMLPNRFPDGHSPPEYNAVDASLWYVNVVAEFFQRADQRGWPVSSAVRQRLESAVEQILQGYASGTRFRIRMDHDGLITAGQPGVQLTWMDAKVGDWVVTPRVGKPVEIQALWLNALYAFRHLSTSYEGWFRQGREVFQRCFWQPAQHCLFDVIDEWETPGRVDRSIRANQIFAVGGLPLVLLSAEQAKAVVQIVEQRLLTPWGLRTLEPKDACYHGRYAGGVRDRDAAYHQGTVWPWLMGPFVEAWLRVHGDTPEHVHLARQRFLDPLENALQCCGLGHLAEVADGDAPHLPGGCPFQAWSLAEFLRLKFEVLADRDDSQRDAAQPARPRPRPQISLTESVG